MRNMFYEDTSLAPEPQPSGAGGGIYDGKKTGTGFGDDHDDLREPEDFPEERLDESFGYLGPAPG